MASSRDVGDIIDNGTIGRLQLSVLMLCFLIMIIDGYDAQAAAFVAPLISAAWHTPNTSLGPAFSAGLLGMALGAMVFGALSDRIGRKVIILCCLVAFGILNVLKIFTGSVGSLTLMQFLAGLGVGGAMPNTIALVSEYSPLRRRALMVTLAAAGYALGAAGAGIVTAQLSARYGWQATFVVGGVAPLILVPLLIWLLPDSVRFMMAKGRSASRVLQILKRADSTLTDDTILTSNTRETKLVGLRLMHLFRDGRAPMTVFLWLAIFMDLLVIYYMASWLVVTLHNVGGVPVAEAAVAASLFSGAGLFGTPIIGQFMDRIGHARMLALSFFAASVCIAIAGSFVDSYVTFRVLLFVAGFFLIGAHLGINAFTSSIYPTFMRGTGVGWALGMGRMSSAISPLLGGVLLSWDWHLPAIFVVVAAPAFFAAICVLTAGFFAVRGSAAPAIEPVPLAAR